MSIFAVLGLLIYTTYIIVDRFVVKLPNKMAIPILVIGIACMAIGFVQMKRQCMF